MEKHTHTRTHRWELKSAPINGLGHILVIAYVILCDFKSVGSSKQHKELLTQLACIQHTLPLIYLWIIMEILLIGLFVIGHSCYKINNRNYANLNLWPYNKIFAYFFSIHFIVKFFFLLIVEIVVEKSKNSSIFFVAKKKCQFCHFIVTFTYEWNVTDPNCLL